MLPAQLIGFLPPNSPSDLAQLGRFQGSQQGIRELGYVTDLPAMWRRAAVFVEQIRKVARPAELQPATFELVVNRRTAKSLGLAIPPGVLLPADRVID